MKLTKAVIYLLLILLLAFVLRTYAANYMDVSTDEMIYSIIPLNIIEAGRLGTVEQSPLFFYLTDIGYKISGGISAISTRWPSIIFGSLAVLVIFLIVREIYDQKVALISSFLFALSGYAVKFNYEMDMGAFFFALLSMYFFVKYLKAGGRASGNSKVNPAYYFYLSTLFLGLGVLIKNIILVFIPAYLIAWSISHYQQKGKFFFYEIFKEKQLLKIVAVSIVIILLVVSPVLIYNYFTYTKVGITDYYFSNIAGIGETVHQGLQGKPWSWDMLQNVAFTKLKQLFSYDFIVLSFGLLGIIYSFKRRKVEVSLFVLSALFFVFYLAGQTGSASHYLWLPMVLSIFAGISMYKLSAFFKQRFKFRHLISVVVIVVFVSMLFTMRSVIDEGSGSITLELRDFVHKNIENDAVVIIDPRIYRGIHAWVFNDKHYLEGTHFAGLLDIMENSPGARFNVPLYYIECGKGTNCGWKPEDFTRIFDTGEKLSSFFKSNTQQVAEIKASHTFIVHRGSITIPSSAYTAIDGTHYFWFYPVGWHTPEEARDSYQTQGWEKVLNGFGFLMLYLDVLVALLTIPFVFWLVLRRS